MKGSGRRRGGGHGGRKADPRAFGLSDEDLRTLGYAIRSAAERPDGPDGDASFAARPPRDSAARVWVVTTLILLGTAWLAHPARHLPAPVPAAAPDTVFSSSRALAELAEIVRVPRPTGSPESERVRNHLVARLRMLGVEAQVQTAMVVGGVEEGRATSVTVRNVVARLPGSGSGGAVVLTAPLDGPPLSQAAGRAVGLVSVLETVRALTAGPPLRTDVVVLFTDGDALGGFGARAFSERHPWARDVRAVVTAEAFGGRGAALPIGDGATDAVVQAALARAGSGSGSGSAASALSSLGRSAVQPPSGWGEGVLQLALVAPADVSVSGLPADTRERIRERTLQHTGAQMLAVTRALAGRGPGDAGGGGATAAARVSAGRSSAWIPGPALATFPAGGAWALAAASFVLLAGLVLLLHWRGIGWRGTVAGAGLAVGTVSASWWMAGTLLSRLASYHPERGAVAGAFYRDGPHVVAVVALAVAVTALAYALARRRFRADEIAVGALSVPVGLGVWVSLRAPAAALALYLPLAVAMAGVAGMTLAGPARLRGRVAWLCGLVTGCSVLLFAVPVMSAAGALWTFAEAASLGALAAVMALLMLPVGEWLVRPRWWYTPVAALGVGVVAVAVTLPAARPRASHPTPTTLVYLADRPVPRSAALVSAVDSVVDPRAPRRMAGQWLTVPGPGEPWARSWAAEAPEPGATPGLLLLPREPEYVLIGGGPYVQLAPPALETLESRVENGRRRVTLELTPGLAGEMVGVALGPEGAELTGVGDERLSGGAPARTLLHWGALEGGSLRIEVDVDTRLEELELTVVEHHLRPDAAFEEPFFERPDSLVPNVATGSDRVIQRTVLRVPVTVDSPADGAAAPLAGATSAHGVRAAGGR